LIMLVEVGLSGKVSLSENAVLISASRY
jgi:hypothetical protein